MPPAKRKKSRSREPSGSGNSSRSKNTPLPNIKLSPKAVQKSKTSVKQKKKSLKPVKKKSQLSQKRKPLKSTLARRRKSRIAPIIPSSTIIRSGGSVVQAPLIYGEIPPSIDTSKLKLSIKQVFMKRNREYATLPKAVLPKQYFLDIQPQLDLFSFKAVVLIVAEVSFNKISILMLPPCKNGKVS
jgi:hypothetical protein